MSVVQDPHSRPSAVDAARYLAALRPALDQVRRGGAPDSNCVIWPAGLDRSLLLSLPLRARTRNAVGVNGLATGDMTLTASQILELRRIGRTAVRDIVQSLNDFLTERVTVEAAEIAASAPRLEAWTRCGESLRPILSMASDLCGASTVADLLSPSTMRVASLMGLSDRLESTHISDLVEGTLPPSSELARKAGQLYAGLSHPHQIVVDHRFLEPRQTLERTARVLGVTRERVRQIQVKLQRRFRNELGPDVQVISSVLKDDLGPVVEPDQYSSRLEEAFPRRYGTSHALCRGFVEKELAFSITNGVCLDSDALSVVNSLRESAAEIADDAGLMEEGRLLRGLPGDQWRRHWPLLRKACAFHQVDGFPSRSRSMKARVKAALLKLGRPATKEEISDSCGIPPSRVGAQLSLLPSVIRADKSRWGLRDWISVEYEGIVGEIVKRIEEDGGVTEVNRVIDELPRQFGVSEHSVRAYLGRHKFRVQNGWVALADGSSILLRSLDDAVPWRDENGDPYWTFTVEDRHLRGYSVSGIPPELARHAGCDPDGMVALRLDEPTGFRDLSLQWRLASMAGVTVGHLREPLRHLDIRPGERARLAIRSDRSGRLTPDRTRLRSETFDELLARLRSRGAVP